MANMEWRSVQGRKPLAAALFLHIRNYQQLFWFDFRWLKKEKHHTFMWCFSPASFLAMQVGAGGGTRTPTMSPSADFESATSTNSITPAIFIYYTRYAPDFQGGQRIFYWDIAGTQYILDCKNRKRQTDAIIAIVKNSSSS